jgi:hypothetical protein
VSYYLGRFCQTGYVAESLRTLIPESEAELNDIFAALAVTESAYVPRTIGLRIGALRTRLLCDGAYTVTQSTFSVCLTRNPQSRALSDRAGLGAGLLVMNQRLLAGRRPLATGFSNSARDF